jgi:hypothetical protein
MGTGHASDATATDRVILWRAHARRRRTWRCQETIDDVESCVCGASGQARSASGGCARKTSGNGSTDGYGHKLAVRAQLESWRGRLRRSGRRQLPGELLARKLWLERAGSL